MDYKLIDNIVMEDVNLSDYPDFSDAHIVSADYNGKEMTEEQLDNLNEDGDFVNEQAHNHFIN